MVWAYWRLLKDAGWPDVLLMLLGTIGALVNGCSTAAIFYVQSVIYDQYGRSSSGKHSDMVASVASKQAVIYVYIGGVTLLAAYLQVSCWVAAGDRQVRRLRLRYVYAILEQDASYFDCKSSSAEIMNDVSSSMMDVEEAIGEKFASFIFYTFNFVSIMALGVLLMWRLLIVAIPFALLLTIPELLYGRAMNLHSRKKQPLAASASMTAKQAVSSIRVVQAFTGEVKVLAQYSASLDHILKLEKSQGLVKGMAKGWTGLRWSIWIFIVWYGSKLVNQGHGNGAQVLSFASAFVFSAQGLGSAIECIKAISEGHASLKRVLDIISQQALNDDGNSDGQIPSHFRGDLSMRNITFFYPSRPGSLILQDFSLEIPAGKVTALVGKSGSGKSTVIALLERFYEPQSGELLLDGIPLKRLSLKWYRKKIGMVSQEPSLFSITIKENILLGDHTRSMEDVIAAAQKANAHNFIMALPEGYETKVGERGTRMSGGQKQRIAIARAILRRPSIMLLDEATSALDNESEKVVQAALEQACENLTTVTIAHRLNSIRNAHRIAVVGCGKLVEFGTQEELLSEGSTGGYASILRRWDRKQDISKPFKALIPKPELSQEPVSLSPPASTKFTENSSEPSNRRKLSFTELLKLNRPESKEAFTGVVLATVQGLLIAGQPIMMAFLYARFYGQDKRQLKHTIAVTSGISVAFTLAYFICGTIEHYCFGLMGAFLTRRITESMFSSILKFEAGWFDRDENSSGAISSRLATQASQVRSLVGDRIYLMIETTATVVLSVVLSFILSWRLAAVVLSVQPVVCLAFYLRLSSGSGHAKKAALTQQNVCQIANDAICQHRTVTAYFLQAKVVNMLKQALNKSGRRNLISAQFAGLTYGLCTLVLHSSYALCVWYGGSLISQDKISFQVFLINFGLLVYMGHSLAETLVLTPDAAANMAVAKAVFEIIDRKPVIDPDEQQAEHLDMIEGKVEFDRVTFAYPSRMDTPVLRSFSLTVEPGQTAALVGSSGSGKSTTIALLERFYDPLEGRVTVDGKDLRTVNLRSLRKQIGLVNQEPTLFAMTIRDNIAYGVDSASDADIVQAARIANAHHFISTLPEGYLTHAGEGGTQLSGGQKQRIAIARAVLKNPRLLLLDEATSALDGESEAEVQRALDNVMLRTTTILVAHRLSTVRDAHLIAVVQDGAVCEKGTHTELLQAQGAYYSLVHSQLAAV